jgi:hypothetical protein
LKGREWVKSSKWRYYHTVYLKKKNSTVRIASTASHLHFKTLLSLPCSVSGHCWEDNVVFCIKWFASTTVLMLSKHMQFNT